jgi:hypothetical protein
MPNQADLRCLVAGFLYTASFACFLPAIGINISFCPAAALRGFFVTWFSLLPCRRFGAELPSGRQRSHHEAAPLA